MISHGSATSKTFPLKMSQNSADSPQKSPEGACDPKPSKTCAIDVSLVVKQNLAEKILLETRKSVRAFFENLSSTKPVEDKSGSAEFEQFFKVIRVSQGSSRCGVISGIPAQEPFVIVSEIYWR